MQRTTQFIVGTMLSVFAALVLAADLPYDQIVRTGVVKVGYREAAFPFSFNTPEKTPSGYSVELCQAALREMGKDLRQPLSIQYVQVSPANRIEKIIAGEIDLECGTTTITKERQKTVNFSSIIFVTGIRALILPDDSIRTARDLLNKLDGKRVAVVDGTTARKVLEYYAPRGIQYVPVKDYKEGIQAVAGGSVTALVGDELLIAGALGTVQTESARKLVFADISYSIEPYGVILSHEDPRLLAAFNSALQRVYASGEAERLLTKWLEKINLKMNTLTRDAFARPATTAAVPF